MGQISLKSKRFSLYRACKFWFYWFV